MGVGGDELWLIARAQMVGTAVGWQRNVPVLPEVDPWLLAR
jgi:hypothetical protein